MFSAEKSLKMHKRRRFAVEITPAAYVFAAVLLLTVPFPWLAAGVVAAAVHELGHLTAIRLLDSDPLGAAMGAEGIKLHIPPMPALKELICTVAGPLGSLLMLPLAGIFPKLSICALIQLLYNCLPVYPLDGGRIVLCVLSLFLDRRRAVKAAKWIERTALLILTFLGLYLSFAVRLGMLPIMLAAAVCGRSLARKRPCKSGRLRVQ